MKVVMGIDAGAASTKVVILEGRRMLGHAIASAKHESSATIAERTVAEALSSAGILCQDIKAIAATGMGKSFIPFVQTQLSEAACSAKGIHYYVPSARTLLDVGAVKSLAVLCGDGMVRAMASHDRCASGTGSYVEMVARILRIPLEASGELSLRSTEIIDVQNTCAVFAESEVISLVHLKKLPEDILWGAFRGLAMRLRSLLLRIKFEQDVVLVGGMAQNSGIVRAIEEQIECPILVPPHPLLVGAAGAAIIAGERLEVSQ